MNSLAPIVLFVYNRPHHTRQTLEALSKNELADKSKLIIYCDGPKPGSSLENINKIKEVRKIVLEKQWCGQVEIIEEDINKGLAASVVAGVTTVVNKYGKIIVLEDDLITSPFFLRFMNEGLEVYKNESNIYSINAFMSPITWAEAHSVLIPLTSTWGWATWKSRWAIYNASMPDKEFIRENVHLAQRFNLADYDYTAMLDFGNNSWGIKWYYSVFYHNGLGVFPTKSLVRNIGFDGSGENCAELDIKSDLTTTPISVIKQNHISIKFYSEYLKYFQSKKSSILKRVINKIKR